jgi:hypothetical protein
MTLAESMMHQASDTAATYLREAKRHVYNCFTVEYCKRNPDFTAAVIAAFMRTAAQDFDSAVRAGIVGGEPPR